MARRRRGHGRRRSHSRIRRSRRGVGGFAGKIKAFFRRPISHVVAPSLAIAGILALFFNPLPNGDGLVNRLQMIFSSKGANLLGADNASGQGNNIFSIIALQVGQNLGEAIPLFAGSIVAGLLGRWTKT
jgi:hypothetical protein